MIKSNRGQLSIFMGITLILVMGMLAFIVNVGLFVKAKINLQNAVDAAAFSGAATQARQLTNMAYVNWEMRNTYKEWMFKYYVLGQLGLMKANHNLTENALTGSPYVSYLLRNVGSAGTAASVGFDKYNVASICIHNNSSTNICPIFSLPGIPRFPAIGVAGISDVHTAFVNTLVQKKGENCSARTQTNFLAALSWAYSSGTKEIPGAPLLATNRPGAWPESLELSMRMRNLEMIMNRPAVADIDFNKARSLGDMAPEIGFNERPIKAFMSAFRNLGGGVYKDNIMKSADSAKDELAASFKLTEISPQPFVVEEKSVSGFLIPNTFDYPGETAVKAFTKTYVDLQAVPLNLAPFFSTFATTKTTFDDGDAVDMEASCGVSKTALPVPGYIMGFVKNPQVITYYAVKGEAEFTGLFFPRSSLDGAGSFKLTAYAAAKPFGGKIGPKLFGFSNGDQSVVAREDADLKSNAYISGIDLGLSGIGATVFKPGMPIPSSQKFWVNNLHPTIGGVPEVNSADIAYAVPNLIYTFNDDSQLAAQKNAAVGKVQMITALFSPSATLSEKVGLYNSFQMHEFKKALGTVNPGTTMSANDLMRALVTARQVTKYDAANYLIPDAIRTGGSSLPTNAAPTVKGEPVAVPGGVGVYYKLFAPLIGDQLLYKTSAEIGSIVKTYMTANDVAIDLYLESLLQVANSIFTLPTSAPTGGQNINQLAAMSIHINANGANNLNVKVPPLLVSADPMDATSPTCKNDMASKFNHFFRAQNTQCGIVPLELLMIEYIDKKNTADGRMFYTSTYYNPLERKSMTAYYPHPRQGVAQDEDATSLGPIGTVSSTGTYSTRRNYYSTKFIPLAKVLSSSNDYNTDVFLESDEKSPLDMPSIDVKNLIKADSTSGLNKPYFLDF